MARQPRWKSSNAVSWAGLCGGAVPHRASGAAGGVAAQHTAPRLHERGTPSLRGAAAGPRSASRCLIPRLLAPRPLSLPFRSHRAVCSGSCPLAPSALLPSAPPSSSLQLCPPHELSRSNLPAPLLASACAPSFTPALAPSLSAALASREPLGALSCGREPVGINDVAPSWGASPGFSSAALARSAQQAHHPPVLGIEPVATRESLPTPQVLYGEESLSADALGLEIMVFI
mmetsp:Transcript_85580/g.198920  ORF Transcript_85580/g.198920 Transcript_85580/m.198920 type:complete len:231 (-) Transcript_85580:115-807(-)